MILKRIYYIYSMSDVCYFATLMTETLKTVSSWVCDVVYCLICYPTQSVLCVFIVSGDLLKVLTGISLLCLQLLVHLRTDVDVEVDTAAEVASTFDETDP